MGLEWVTGYYLLYCRTGFEEEAAAEMVQRATAAGFPGRCQLAINQGWVKFMPQQPDIGGQLFAKIPFATLIFIRQWVCVQQQVVGLVGEDRVTRLMQGIQAMPVGPFLNIWLETADTNEAKTILNLCRALTPRIDQAAEALSLVHLEARWRAHLFFYGHDQVDVGFSPIDNAAAWPMGIMRLKSQAGAPNRGTLKIEEAFHHFLTAQERQRRLGGRHTAVDLGAAPGGWSFYLAQQGVRVVAVDRGGMDPMVMATGRVIHSQSNGFHFIPQRPVDWLLCDMVEKPRLIAELIAKWFGHGWCREAIFNLKLPMKKRLEEVRLCSDLIHRQLALGGGRLRFKQLYHDRSEVTGHLVLRSRGTGGGHLPQ